MSIFIYFSVVPYNIKMKNTITINNIEFEIGTISINEFGGQTVSSLIVGVYAENKDQNIFVKHNVFNSTIKNLELLKDILTVLTTKKYDF